jgi:hypothetical protein
MITCFQVSLSSFAFKFRFQVSLSSFAFKFNLRRCIAVGVRCVGTFIAELAERMPKAGAYTRSQFSST